MLMPRAACIEKNNCVIKEGFYLVRLEIEQLQTRKFSFVVLNRGEIKLKVAEFAVIFCWPYSFDNVMKGFLAMIDNHVAYAYSNFYHKLDLFSFLR